MPKDTLKVESYRYQEKNWSWETSPSLPVEHMISQCYYIRVCHCQGCLSASVGTSLTEGHSRGNFLEFAFVFSIYPTQGWPPQKLLTLLICQISFLYPLYLINYQEVLWVSHLHNTPKYPAYHPANKLTTLPQEWSSLSSWRV